MSQSAETRSPSGWFGWVVFAAFIMIVNGFFNVIEGLAALIKDEEYFVTRAGLLAFDYTSWGWIHLIMGALLLLVGFALLRGATWARIVGVFVVGLNMIAQFAWMGAYPVWAIIAIAFDLAVLWALIVHGGEVDA